ncbi:SdpI family protein [Pedobacter sp. MC2016-24]|uniref:SdpI family protein n=1 Tax=Pedobacter sp. MC2016-24 TaxID=2780090 RepID=UPI0018803F4D|nr:SdpI family protein [Pedobacter sp. MC2016-24]MBE9601952.1 SdpI family protein [Pedobacter sp. MC2016-24]
MDGNTQLLIASSLLFVISLIFRIFPPKNINSFYGYRTNNSMKDEESWKYGNRISSTIMVLGFGTLVIQKVLFIVIFPNMGLLNAILFLGITFITLILTFLITESYLRSRS